MAIEVAPGARGRSLLLDGLAQSDVDMNFHKLLNLDTSNLEELGKPPTIVPPANNWLKAWDNPSNTWTHQQINFSHLGGLLTRAQQDDITHLGIISTGTWQGKMVQPTYLPTLDLIRFPVNNLNLASRRIVNLADPVNPQDAVSKHFMDFLLQGLNPKEAVRCASTSHRTHAGLFPNVGGVPLVDGDRVLLKNQSTGHEAENRIWIARTGSWDTPDDADTFDELNRAYVSVREGTQAGTSWVQVLEQTAEGQPKQFVLFSTAGGEPGPPGANGQGVPAGGADTYILAKASGGDYDTEWVPPPAGFGTPPAEYATLQTGVLSPAGTTNTTGRMMGLAGIITPTATGTVIATIAGFIYNTSAAGAATARLCAGSGSAPANGAIQPVGTSVLVGAVAGVSSIGASKAVPFSVTAVIHDLTVGIPFWFDILLQAVTTGTATIGGVSISAYEIP